MRTPGEDIDHWLGWVDGKEPEKEVSPMLLHLTNLEILGLGDGYDDPRIDTLIKSYLRLRDALHQTIKLIS